MKPKGHKRGCRCPFCARARKGKPRKRRANATLSASNPRRKRRRSVYVPAAKNPRRKRRKNAVTGKPFGIIKLNAGEAKMFRNGQPLVIKDRNGRVLRSVRG